MPLDSIADLERRIRRLEMELDQYKHKFVAPDRTVKTEPPLAHIDHGSLAGLGDDDHPQYRKVADSIDHGALTGLGDNDHPQYLLTTGKAADSDKLDGVDSTGFATATHNHTGTYLPIDGKAADSDKLDGVDITAFKGLNSLADPDADRVLFWDDSAGTLKWLTVSTGLALSDTSLALSHLGLQSLTDPDADRVLFWDDSAGMLKWLTVEGIVDTDFGKWTSWTPTQTGWTALPNGVYRYCKIGKLVMGIIYMSAGTSNSTAAELSLPFTAASNNSSMRGTTGWAMDNSVIQTQPGTWVVGAGATVIKLYKTFPDGAWTASGTKRIITVFFYEAA